MRRNEDGTIWYGLGIDQTQLRGDAKQSSQIFRGIGDTVEKEGQRIDGTFKRIAMGIGAIGSAVAVGSLANDLYAFANAFDKTMKEVSTLSTTVSNDLDGFKKGILDMTTEIPVGADAAAKALYQIVSAGHDGANGMKVLEVASKAAIGGVTETVTAADAITTIINAYKLSASEATNISDQLFTTVRLGKTTFGELGKYISQVAPIAGSFGIETEQVLAAVATLTKSGTPTAQAMTQIRSSIIAANKVLGDGYFRTHTFQEGLQEIANKAGGSESKLRKLVPEVEAMNGILGMTGINAKMAASDLGELGNSLGASEQAFQKMNNTADAQLTLLKNKMLAKFHDIGAGAVDMVGSIAKFLNKDGVFSSSALDDLIATMGVLIATVGVYKAQIMITNAVAGVGQNLRYTAEIAELQKLLLVKKSDENQDLQKLVLNKKLSADQAAKIVALRAEIQAKLDVMKVDVASTGLELKNAKESLATYNKRTVQIDKTIELEKKKLAGMYTSVNAEKLVNVEREKGDLLIEKSLALSDERNLTNARALKNAEIANLKGQRGVRELIRAKKDEVKVITDRLNSTQKELSSIDSSIAAKTREIKEINNASSSTQRGTIHKKLNSLEIERNSLITDKNTTKKSISKLTTDLESKSLAHGTLQQQLNNASIDAGVKSKNLMILATKRLGTALRGLGKAFMANPFGLALMAITMAITAFSLFKKEAEEVADATEVLTNKTRELTSAIEDLSASKYLQTKSFEDLQKLYPATLKNMTLEKYLIADKTALLKRMNEESERGAFKKQDSDLVGAKSNLAKLEYEYASVKKSIHAGASIGRLKKQIMDAKEQLKEAEKIIEDRDTILRKLAEPPKATMSIEAQIKAIDSDIEKLDAHTARLSEKMIKRDAAVNGFLLSGNINTESAGYKPFEFKLDPDLAVDPEIKSMQNIERKEQLKIEKAELLKQLEDQAKAKIKAGKEVADEHKKIQEEIAKELQDLEESNLLESQDRKIALMAEGVDKEIAQINLDYDRKIAALKIVTAKWKAEQGDSLTVDQSNTVAAAEKGYEQDRDISTRVVKADQAKEDKAELDALLKELETFEQKRIAITEKYNKDRELIINSDKNLLDKGNAIGGLEDNYDKDIESVDNAEFEAAKKGSIVIAQVFEDASSKSIADIDKIRDKANSLISYLANTKPEAVTAGFGMSAEQLKTLQASSGELESLKNGVDALHTAGVKKNPFGQMAADIEDLFKSGDKGEGLEKKLAKLGQSAGASANMIGGLSGGLSDMFAAAGNEEMAGVASGVEMAMTSVSNVASGFANGGIVGGIAAAAGELINYATMAFEAEAVHQAALEAIVQSKIAQQEEYNSLLRDQNLLFEQGVTAFGNDSYGKASNAIKQSYTDISDAKAQAAKIAEVEIVTGHKKTGFMGWGKGKDTYSNILDVYPLLIDAEGNLDVERAKSILTTQNMSDAHKQAIEDGIEAVENYEESVAIMNDYLADIFGDMGSSMADMITDNWRNNTDDALDYGSAVAGMLEQLAQDVAMSMHFAPVLSKAQLEIDKINSDTSLTEEQRALALSKIATDTAKSLAAAKDGYIDTLEVMQDAAAEEGVEIFKPDKEEDTREASSASSGITASQESVNVVTGIATNIQGHTYEMNEGIKSLTGYAHSFKESFSWLQSNAASQLEALHGIRDNTAPIAAIHEEMASMRGTLEDIQIHGLKMKRQ